MPNLADKAACVGCTACASVCPNNCIEMREDSDGFLYPEINLQKGCVECRRCETVCPVLGKSFSGELPIAYAAISLDESIRMKSSSGGLFTELAKRIIAQNGVVYGAAYDKQFKVYHYCVDNVDDLHKLRGAKYAESNLGNSFVDVLTKLKQDQIVMFSGTPCQIAGLKTFLKRDYENLYCVDFVCHGVPSPMAWRAYVEYRANVQK